MIITIDGPAGSGKSTIAREVAKRLGMRYLDSGALYRAVTLLALEAGLVPDRIYDAGALAANIPLRLEGRPDDLTRVFVGEREITDPIRGRLVSQNVSAVSADAGVRAVLTERQRAEAANDDVVLEGRDTGTVVFPDADLKIFMTASIEERARRRQKQLEAQGVFQSLDELIADISARDAYDSGRALAPLRKADDAVEIDSTGLSIEQVIDLVCARVETVRSRAPLSSAVAVRPAAPFGSPASLGSPALAGSRATQTSTEADPEVGAHSEAGPLAQPSAQTEGSPYSPQKWPLSGMTRGPLDTLLYRFAYWLIPPLWKAIFRMSINGREHFPLGGAVVLASNHRSNLDPFFLGVASPRQIHFMAKAELFKVKPLAKLIEKMGTFPISRGEADRQAVRRAFQVLAAGGVLGIFPEGHRQRQGGFGEIHPGVTLFSLRDEVVTIPVVIEGSERVVRNHRICLPRVRVSFGSPLEVPGKGGPPSQRALIASERLVDSFRSLASGVEEGA